MDVQKYFVKNYIFFTLYFDNSIILRCNSISLIPFNSLQPQLLFDVLYFKMDQIAMKLSIKT